MTRDVNFRCITSRPLARIWTYIVTVSFDDLVDAVSLFSPYLFMKWLSGVLDAMLCHAL